MCDPKSVAQMGLAFDVSAGALGTVAAYRNAGIEQTVAENNAALADAQAKDALDRGARTQAEIRRRGAKVKGRQVAAFGSGNVQLQGSALDVLEETDRMTELDAATAGRNAEGEAGARRFEAAGYRARARGTNPGLAGFTSLLSNAGRVADRWYNYSERY